MSKLEWDKTGERLYETGVNQVALYPVDSAGKYGNGVAWNGVTAINESPSGAEPTALWADNIKYLNLMSAEEFGATIEAYTYPDEFAECDGSAKLNAGITVGQQKRKMFGLCYKTLLGNDTENNAHGYKLHLIYGCLASPSERSYETVNDDPDAITFSWELTTTPVPITKTIGDKKFEPTSLMTIDSTTVDKDALKKIEDALYGTESEEPKLLLPDDIVDIINSAG